MTDTEPTVTAPVSWSTRTRATGTLSSQSFTECAMCLSHRSIKSRCAWRSSAGRSWIQFSGMTNAAVAYKRVRLHGFSDEHVDALIALPLKLSAQLRARSGDGAQVHVHAGHVG